MNELSGDEGLEVFDPCPFCGTRIDDPKNPASQVVLPNVTFECGGCGAQWPALTKEIARKFKRDEEFLEFFNRRALSKAGND